MKKKVFITGATGFIGSHLVRRLLSDRKYEIHILRRKTSSIWRIKDILGSVKSHFCDITEKNKLKVLITKIQPDIIFHLANIGVYGGREGNAEDVIKVNFLGTVNLIDACNKVNYTCFINTGSSSEYGEKDKAMKEGNICEPQGIYALSKLAATLYAKDYAIKSNKPVVTLRIFTPYGPYDDENRLIPYVVNSLEKGENLFLANKKNVRDFVFIDDVVNGFLLAVKHAKDVKGEVINIGSGKQTTVDEIVKKIIDMTKDNVEIIWNSEIKKRYESIVWKADIKKAKKLLRWQPTYSLENGLKKTILWTRR